MADAAVLNTAGSMLPCGFESHLRHHDSERGSARRSLRGLKDLTRGEIKAMSPEEYQRAVVSGGVDYGEGLDVGAGIITVGGWIPAGIMAIVAGIGVGLVSGDWSRFLLIAFGGTIVGYLAVMAAIPAFDNLDIRWLRTGRPDEAWLAILLMVGPAVALLVAVLVFTYVM